ncbi:MAG TPA: hypothetical protein VKX33_05615 [Cyclobacteriaceae bacterium]|nr:hypothetical protein [Cyclobacteriaceae bacterium]
MMRKKRVESKENDSRKTSVTDNPFTQAVKKASGEEGFSLEEETSLQEGDAPKISLKAKDELMRAQEAKNDTSVEGEKFRRDGD